MKKTLVPLLALLCLCAYLPKQAAATRPNFVLIIADDMAWDDCGAYGHRSIRTPQLDRLAQSGLRFDRAFVAASSCSPSRASLLTGRYPHSADAEQLHWPVPAEQTTFVELLKAAGYWTAAAGKWHLGEAVRDRFDLVKEADPRGFILPRDPKVDPKTLDVSGTGEWLNLLRQRPQEKPFFLWLAAFDPHRDYEEGSIAKPYKPADVVVPPYLPDTPEVRKDLALYYDEITRLDEKVGKVLAELERQNVARETLVLFLSDNGRPFPRAKTTLFDSGIRTPLIVRWPGKIKAGGVTRSLVSAVDIGPTFLELAGVKLSPTFQGRSFAAVLRNPERQIRDAIYAEKNWHDYEDRSRAVRTARFKYIRNYYNELPLTPSADAWRGLTGQALRQLRDTGRLTPQQLTVFQSRAAEELYDTLADPHEFRNLAGDARYSATLRSLRVKLQAWEAETADRTPLRRTPDEFDRETGEPLPNRISPRPGKEAFFKP